jgi:hypothetical protein
MSAVQTILASASGHRQSARMVGPERAGASRPHPDGEPLPHSSAYIFIKTTWNGNGDRLKMTGEKTGKLAQIAKISGPGQSRPTRITKGIRKTPYA